jgi:hypothetical protein
MRMSKVMKVSSVFTMSVTVAIFLGAFGAMGAQVTVNQPSGQAKPLPGIQLHGTVKPMLCPDLRVNLTLVKGQNGLVTMLGTVTNIGKGDFNIASEAQVIMNLSYPPQYSYAMSGVSDVLITMNFTNLKAGASFPLRGTFQIPDFGGWDTASVQGNAKRLFTLRVIKQDMSTYKPGEDCNPENNSKSVELMYRENKH